MAVGNANYDTLLATTLANHRKEMTDNVFLALPLVWFLLEKNQVRMEDGGHKIVEPLIYAAGQVGSYNEWEQLSIAPQGGITAAEFPWKHIYSTIAISGPEEFKNSGRQAVLNMLKAKIKQSEKSLRNHVGSMVYGDGTGNAGKDWMGLKGLVGNTTVGHLATVGGIVVADNVWWRSPSYVKNVVATNPPANLQAWLRTAYNAAADGNDTVGAIFADVATHELYESQLTPNVRFEDVKSANAGFTTLMFKQVPIYLDKNITTPGTVYGINSDYLSVVGGKGRWFKQSSFSGGVGDNAASAHATSGAASTVDGKYAVITTYGNMTVSNRQRHFRIDGIGQA